MDPRTRMAHFLRRAGFGIAPGELESRLEAGYEATVSAFLEPGGTPDGLGGLDQLIGGILDFSNVDDVRAWWIYRMCHSARPLVEKMTFFWHGHFATAVGKAGPYLMYGQNQLFRERGLGDFGELLLRVARDPAMLVYLDGAQNKKGHPNENFAREVMELFTTGIGHYTEKDVQESARAFTGWTVRDNAFFFNPADHDAGVKTVLGTTGELDGADVLRVLAEHPATAERMVGKLFRFFVHDEPDAKTLAPFVRTWKDSRGSVRETLRAIFLSPVFCSEQAYRAKVKSPAEYVIGTIRALGGTVTPRGVVALMARMGQDLFNPPSVKGWDGGRAWLSTSTLFERFNFAASVTTQRGPEGTSHVVPEALFSGNLPTSAHELVELTVEHLLDGRLPQASREALLAYLDTPDPQALKDAGGKRPQFALDKRMMDEKVRGLLHLVLSSPEYQLA